MGSSGKKKPALTGGPTQPDSKGLAEGESLVTLRR